MGENRRKREKYEVLLPCHQSSAEGESTEELANQWFFWE